MVGDEVPEVTGSWVTEVLVGHFNSVGFSFECDGKPVGGFEERSVKTHSLLTPNCG